MKKIKVGKKAILFKTDQTESKCGYYGYMPKVGDKLMVLSINKHLVNARLAKSSEEVTYSYHIEDLKRVEKKSKEPKEAKKVVGGTYKVIKDCEFDKGDIVNLIHNDGSDCPLFKRESDGQEWYELLDNLKLLKDKKKQQNKEEKESQEEIVPISPRFDLGDIVRIINNTGGSINSIGDIGVVSELNGITGVRVTVPGKDNQVNWSNVEDVDALGLVGSVK